MWGLECDPLVTLLLYSDLGTSKRSIFGLLSQQESPFLSTWFH